MRTAEPSSPPPALTPRLVVDGADRAIELYERVLGAKVLERFATKQGKVVHAALSIRGSVISLTDADPPVNTAPDPDAAPSILLHVDVEDPDAIADAFAEAGGAILIPVDDRFYGAREGRVRDPFGHCWIVSRKLGPLGDDEIQTRLDQQ